MQWFRNLVMEGGPLQHLNAFALTFSGGNISQKEVKLKVASIISAVNGREITLDVIAEGKAIPIDQIELVSWSTGQTSREVRSS